MSLAKGCGNYTQLPNEMIQDPGFAQPAEIAPSCFSKFISFCYTTYSVKSGICPVAGFTCPAGTKRHLGAPPGHERTARGRAATVMANATDLILIVK